MSVLRDSRTGIVPATIVYLIHLLQSVAFSMNSCQQFEGYRTEYTGQVHAKPQSIK